MTEDIVALLPLLVFVGLLALSLRVRRTERPDARVRAFAIYVVVCSFAAGLLRVDLWPFAAWSFATYSIGDHGSFTRFVGVDGAGDEHPLDARAFEPLEGPELQGWVSARLESPDDRDEELLGFVLERAQTGLARARAGDSIGSFDRFLGPLAAPLFQGAAEEWSDPERLPTELVAVRVYRVDWRVDGATIVTDSPSLIADTGR